MASWLRHLVVGVDGSAAGASALRWAGWVAARADAEVIAVNAFENPWSEVTPEDHDRLLREREDLVATVWADEVGDTGASVRTTVREGGPRAVVLNVAAEEEADLVVLGRTGVGGGPGFLHLGSVVEYAVHRVRRPLAVIPPTTSAPIERIVVGVDGSSESLQALEWTGRLAALTGASVVAVAVEEPVVEWTPGPSVENWRRDVERQLEQWTERIVEAGSQVEHVAQRDLHPVDGLLGVASARGGDLLVVGTRGTGGLTGLRVGGIAMKVLHRASMPIVLVPPQAPLEKRT